MMFGAEPLGWIDLAPCGEGFEIIGSSVRGNNRTQKVFMLAPILRALSGHCILLIVSVGLLPAQQDVTDLFDQNPFYEKAGVLRGRGEIPFFADISFLKGGADSTQAVLGISLSNSVFQFIKETNGYRATYSVDLTLKGSGGSFRRNWKETVRVASFDETLLTHETIVFQSTFGLRPGEYDLDLEVQDTQSGQSSELESKLKVPRIGLDAGGLALSRPVLLRYFKEAESAGSRDHVLYPSHYFERPPQSLSFFVEVYAAPGASDRDLTLVASLSPAEDGTTISTASFDVPAIAETGSARIYGSIPASEMVAGLYRLTISLRDAAGTTLAEQSTEVSVSAVTQWVRENWEDALELLAYEGKDDEMDALEGTPPERRLAAWNEFWEVRDPIPATPGNEAFENYFRRIAVANANFTTKLRPGWKSDRGRVYVAFGPPNDIVRRPVPSGSFPLEVWVYDQPGFEIGFEDRIGFGNYQMINPGTFASELAALERRKHRAIAERREQRERNQGQEGEGGSEQEEASPDTSRG
jgi:GWxTD domain-containing protein